MRESKQQTKKKENKEMADVTNNKVDMSAIAFDLAKNAGWNDEKRFKQFEKDFVKKFYEVIGLSDIPDEFLNFTRFIDAYSGVLVKSVQNDLAIMNLTKRLAMFKLSENIAQTAEKPKEDAVPQTNVEQTGFDPTAQEVK